MKNSVSKSIGLGVCTAIIAGACYALIPINANKSSTEPTAEALKITAASANSIDSAANKIEIKPDFAITDHLIQPGESLSVIFSKLGMDSLELHKIVHANDLGKQFAAIKPGKFLRFETTDDGELQQLSYPKNAVETLIAKRFGEKFVVENLTKKVESRVVSAQTTIESSLFLDAKKAGLTDKLIMELANIFAWDVDFALSLRAGDQFTVIYEKNYIGDQEIGTGDILVAEFVNRGRIYQAVRYQDETGNANYYSPQGKSLRKAFLRTPIEFARISSHFNLKRRHPVLNRIRAHKGVDYAAKTGTRIKTTGKGFISFRGYKRGYGRVVIVQHGKKYTTLYAHLSKFGKNQRVGHRVNQGDVIGYVGQSGLATGPHLHYEFRVNGKHRNPLTVRLPHDPEIKPTKLAAFKNKIQPLLLQLYNAKATAVASNEF